MSSREDMENNRIARTIDDLVSGNNVTPEAMNLYKRDSLQDFVNGDISQVVDSKQTKREVAIEMLSATPETIRSSLRASRPEYVSMLNTIESGFVDRIWTGDAMKTSPITWMMISIFKQSAKQVSFSHSDILREIKSFKPESQQIVVKYNQPVLHQMIMRLAKNVTTLDPANMSAPTNGVLASLTTRTLVTNGQDETIANNAKFDVAVNATSRKQTVQEFIFKYEGELRELIGAFDTARLPDLYQKSPAASIASMTKSIHAAKKSDKAPIDELTQYMRSSLNAPETTPVNQLVNDFSKNSGLRPEITVATKLALSVKIFQRLIDMINQLVVVGSDMPLVKESLYWPFNAQETVDKNKETKIEQETCNNLVIVKNLTSKPMGHNTPLADILYDLMTLRSMSSQKTAEENVLLRRMTAVADYLYHTTMAALYGNAAHMLEDQVTSQRATLFSALRDHKPEILIRPGGVELTAENFLEVIPYDELSAAVTDLIMWVPNLKVAYNGPLADTLEPLVKYTQNQGLYSACKLLSSVYDVNRKYAAGILVVGRYMDELDRGELVNLTQLNILSESMKDDMAFISDLSFDAVSKELLGLTVPTTEESNYYDNIARVISEVYPKDKDYAIEMLENKKYNSFINQYIYYEDPNIIKSELVQRLLRGVPSLHQIVTPTYRDKYVYSFIHPDSIQNNAGYYSDNVKSLISDPSKKLKRWSERWVEKFKQIDNTPVKQKNRKLMANSTAVDTMLSRDSNRVNVQTAKSKIGQNVDIKESGVQVDKSNINTLSHSFLIYEDDHRSYLDADESKPRIVTHKWSLDTFSTKTNVYQLFRNDTIMIEPLVKFSADVMNVMLLNSVKHYKKTAYKYGTADLHRFMKNFYEWHVDYVLGHYVVGRWHLSLYELLVYYCECMDIDAKCLIDPSYSSLYAKSKSMVDDICDYLNERPLLDRCIQLSFPAYNDMVTTERTDYILKYHEGKTPGWIDSIIYHLIKYGRAISFFGIMLGASVLVLTLVALVFMLFLNVLMGGPALYNRLGTLIVSMLRSYGFMLAFWSVFCIVSHVCIHVNTSANVTFDHNVLSMVPNK